MAGEKRERARTERLERVAREVVRASAAGEAEAESVANSPFLYARVRARIEAERRRREEGEGRLALWLCLSSGAGERGAQVSGFGLGEALLGERDGDIEQVVFADARRATARSPSQPSPSSRRRASSSMRARTRA